MFPINVFLDAKKTKTNRRASLKGEATNTLIKTLLRFSLWLISSHSICLRFIQGPKANRKVLLLLVRLVFTTREQLHFSEDKNQKYSVESLTFSSIGELKRKSSRVRPEPRFSSFPSVPVDSWSTSRQGGELCNGRKKWRNPREHKTWHWRHFLERFTSWLVSWIQKTRSSQRGTAWQSGCAWLCAAARQTSNLLTNVRWKCTETKRSVAGCTILLCEWPVLLRKSPWRRRRAVSYFAGRQNIVSKS